MTARLGAYAAIATTLAVHAACAWLYPLQADDWGKLMWARSNAHREGLDWLLAWLGSHGTSSDLVAYALAHSPAAHAIVTPLATLAVVAGAFTVAHRRPPRLDAWGDVGLAIVLYALLWITTPRAGLTLFYRPYAATWVLGTAATLWFIAAFRCAWRPRGPAVAALCVCGIVAGSSSRQLAVAALVATIVAIVRTSRPRPRWTYLALGGLVLGAIAAFRDTPQVDFRGFKPGFEASLKALNLSIREGGELITLVLGLVGIALVLGRVRLGWRPAGSPDTSETLGWLWIWLGLTVAALFGPRYSEASLFPTSVVLCMAALPYIRWLGTSRPLRRAIAVIAAGTVAIVWVLAATTYRKLGAEFDERMARIAATPADEVAVIEPYSRVRPSFWFFGEDWAEIGSRQLLAIELFGVRGIKYATPFSRLEHDPHLQLALEVEGVPADQLAAARPPVDWGSNVTTARGQFAQLVKVLARANGRFSARLVVKDLALDVLRGRPLLVAAYGDRDLYRVRTGRRGPDEHNLYSVRLRPPALVLAYPESYAVVGEHTRPIAYERRGYRIPVMNNELHAIVACSADACVLVDAFVPRL